MRTITIAKIQTATKPVTNLSVSNSSLDTSSQTSIEIALKIDENRMTTLRHYMNF